MVSLPKMVASRSQSATISSSSLVLASATISPSGLTMTLPAIKGWPSSTPPFATATTQVEF
jgi:hypothetical protein